MSGTTSGDEEEGRQSRRKQKQHAHLSSGCGFGRPKKKLLEAFWNVLWPQLVTLGWTKVELDGKQEGTLYFVPKDIDVEIAKKGHDYYDRVRDVIDRIIERRTPEESTVADSFLSDMEVLEELEELEIIPRVAEDGNPRVLESRSPPRSRSPRHVDVSWKYVGSVYKRKASRVGEEFNATSIPVAGSFKSMEDGSEESEEMKLCELIFDYRCAEEQNILSYINSNVPFNKKEIAVACAAQNDYQLQRMIRIVGSSKPHDGSDWKADEKEEFRKVIYSHKKDVVATAKALKKSINDVYTYYLGSFKKSDDYRLLKVICDEARSEKHDSSEHGLDACGYCGDGGSLLICDGCEGEYHMACTIPPLITIPEGHWECDDCVNRKFLDVRDNLIQNSRFFERVHTDEGTKQDVEEVLEPHSKKLKTETEFASVEPITGGEIMLRPSSPVIASVHKLVACISQALAAP